MSINTSHAAGQPQRPWPPVQPSDKAEKIAAGQLFKRVKQYLRDYPQQETDDYAIAMRLLRHQHIGAMIGYDIDERRLEVIIYYAISIRNKFTGADIQIDDRLPREGVSTVMNSMDPLDLPVVADGLAWEYLDALREDHHEKSIAVLAQESVLGTDMRELKRRLRMQDEALRRIHEQILTGTLDQA